MERTGPHRIAFFLIPEFPIYAVIPATEALRIANSEQRPESLRLELHLARRQSGPRRNGMMVAPDASIEGEPGFTTLIVCAGNHPTQYLDRRLLNWLRRLDRYGTALGALDTGSFALAAAGLMKGYRMTLHWEAMPLFHEHYPDLDVREQIFVMDAIA